MVSKDKKIIAVALPKEMIEVMEQAIASDTSGHRITKSDIIITALAMLFGLANERAKTTEHKEEC